MYECHCMIYLFKLILSHNKITSTIPCTISTSHTSVGALGNGLTARAPAINPADNRIFLIMLFSSNDVYIICEPTPRILVRKILIYVSQMKIYESKQTIPRNCRQSFNIEISRNPFLIKIICGIILLLHNMKKDSTKLYYYLLLLA